MSKLSQFEQLAKDMVLGNSTDHFDLLLNTYNLKDYFARYLEIEDSYKRMSNVMQRLPSVYHSVTHTCLVMLNTAEGCWHGGIDYTQTRIALVAALFHDCCHSNGWEVYDHFNIGAAVSALARSSEVSFEGRLSDEDLAKAHNIILGTEFPQPTSSYLKKEMKPLIEIVRLADIMTAYYRRDGEGTGAGRFKLFMGLKAEMELRKSPIRMDEFIYKQNKFAQQAGAAFSQLRWAKVKYISQDFPKEFRTAMHELKIYDFLLHSSFGDKRQHLIDDLSYAYLEIQNYKETQGAFA